MKGNLDEEIIGRRMVVMLSEEEKELIKRLRIGGVVSHTLNMFYLITITVIFLF